MALPETVRFQTRPSATRQARHAPLKTYPLLLYGALLGLHINLALPLFGGNVPNIIAAPFALALIGLHWRRLPPRAAPWLIAMVGLFIVSAIYAMGLFEATVESPMTIVLLCYTLLLGLGVFLEISAMSPTKLNRLAFVVAIGMTLFAFLEVYTPVQDFAIWFDQFYTIQVQSIFRDIALYGGYRPRILASEASRAAIGLSLVLSVWVFTTRRWTSGRVAFFGIIMLCGLLVIRSPFTILPAVLFAARLVLWPESGAAKRQEGIAIQAGRLAIIAVGGLMAAVLLSSALGIVFGNRISMFDTRSDWSVTVRTYGAAQAGWNAAVARPVFGAGVNNFEAAPEVATTFRALGVPAYITETEALEVSVANALAVSLIYFGFGGILVFFWIWDGLMRALCPAPPWTMRWAVLIAVSLGYSEIYSPAFVWTVLVLLAGLVVGAKPLETRYPPASRRRPNLTRGLATEGAAPGGLRR